MTANVPEEIVLDLDVLERKPEDVVKPFKVNLAGRVLTMTDPAEIDWQDLLLLDDPVELIRYVLSDEDRDFLRDQKMPGWKLEILMEAYSKHYRLDKKMEDARRQAALQNRRVI